MWSGARYLCRPTTTRFLKCYLKPVNYTRSYIGFRPLAVSNERFNLAATPSHCVLNSNLGSSSSHLSSPISWRYFTVGSAEDGKPPPKPSLYQRFKAMYKDYWYVLIPVHVVTSCMWFGAFFYTARSGFDIAGAIEFLNLNEEIMDKIRHSANSTAGHITLAYLLYKIFTPLRYTVTLGGTTYSIRFLTSRGLLKKMPKKEELKQMYVERKDQLKDRKDTFKKEIAEKFSSSKKSNP